MIASSSGFVLTLFTGVIYVWFWNTPIIRASGRELSCLILIGVSLLFVVPILFCVEPTAFMCGSRFDITCFFKKELKLKVSSVGYIVELKKKTVQCTDPSNVDISCETKLGNSIFMEPIKDFEFSYFLVALIRIYSLI